MPDREKHTCAIMLRTKMAWSVLNSSSSLLFPRLEHKDYEKNDKVLFWNADHGWLLKCDLRSFKKTTIGQLTPDECKQMDMPEDLAERVGYMCELWADDNLNLDTRLTLLECANVLQPGTRGNWQSVWSRGKTKD